MDCGALLLAIQAQDIECSALQIEWDNCQMTLQSMWMMYWYYCGGA